MRTCRSAASEKPRPRRPRRSSAAASTRADGFPPFSFARPRPAWKGLAVWTPEPDVGCGSVQGGFLEKRLSISRAHPNARHRAFAHERHGNLDACGAQAPDLAEQVREAADARA